MKNADFVTKIHEKAPVTSYSHEEREILLDVLTNHYDALSSEWLVYYEEILTAGVCSTKT